MESLGNKVYTEIENIVFIALLTLERNGGKIKKSQIFGISMKKEKNHHVL